MPTWSDQAPLVQFVDEIVETFLLNQDVPAILDTLRESGVEGPFVEKEALLFAVVPMLVMLGPAFGPQAERFNPVILEAVDRLGGSSSPVGSECQTRIGEYLSLLLEHSATGRLSFPLEIRENGLVSLAKAGCRHIANREIQDIAVLMPVWTHYSATVEAWDGGKKLKELYELLLNMGVEQWRSSVRDALAEEG